MAEEITLRKNFWASTREYVSDVRAEMKRVTWPGRQEIYGTTVMVIATTFAFGFYFWLCDSMFSYLVKRVLDWLGQKG